MILDNVLYNVDTRAFLSSLLTTYNDSLSFKEFLNHGSVLIDPC